MTAVSRLRHVTLVAGDLAASIDFYDAALGALGISRTLEFGDEEEDEAEPLEAVGYASGDGAAMFWVVAGADATRSAHVAFGARTREEVDAFFAAGVAAGGVAAQAPRRWEIYRPGYYGAIVADPDGNLVEALTEE